MQYFLGISSGVICVIFGLYEKMLNSVLDFFKNVKKNISFLFPLLLGIIVGILIFSKLLNYLLYAFPVQTKSAFVGLILTTVPSLLKDVNKKTKFKLHFILFLVFALLLGIFSTLLENALAVSSSNEFNYYYLVFCGFCMSIGIVVPGVSSTIILMLLGVYSAYLTSIANFYLPILAPIGIGLVLGSFVFMKVTKYFLDNHYAETFYTIIGFTLGSILVIWPDFTPDISGFFSCICMLIGPIFAIIKG